VSRPKKPGELRDVELDAVSLVTKAANGERYKIFKSEEEAEMGKNQPPEVVAKDERGLFHVLKAFFTGEGAAIEKGELMDSFNVREKGRRLGVAIDALWSTLKYDRWGGQNEKAETDPKKIRAALEDFKKIAEEILLGKDEDIVKIVEEIEKSGRKISAARLSELKAAHVALSRIIDDVDADAGAEEGKGAASEVTKEDLAKIVKAGVDEGTKPLLEKLEKLEKQEKAENGGEEGTSGSQEPKTAENAANAAEIQPSDIAEVVKSAVTEATATLAERLEKVEKARGFSNRIPEDAEITKNDSLFGGVFTSV
jgi:hypothetical protein